MLIALVVATFFLGMVPGPAVFATVSRSLTLGLRSTYLFILGILSGDFLFSLLAMTSFAALANIYAPLFFILKIIGGGYLIYVGYNNIKNSKMPRLTSHNDEEIWKLFTSGFLLTASNPKDILFFVGFLPAFVDLKNANITLILTASGTIVATFFVTLSIYALLSYWIQRLLRKRRYIHNLNEISGVLLIGIGLYVLFY
ncbi:MAG: LysE family translocator [Alphaproteobacteria bacterium]|nr:LysE family translocator [Alphaproteobacteria bacterium]